MIISEPITEWPIVGIVKTPILIEGQEMRPMAARSAAVVSRASVRCHTMPFDSEFARERHRSER
jgi:hypothetical protein